MAHAFHLQAPRHSVLSSIYTYRTVSLSKKSKAKTIYLYNAPRHLLSQKLAGWIRFELLCDAKVVASVSFNVDLAVARSPFRAPFGGLEIEGKGDQQVLERWWREGILMTLKMRGVKQLELKRPPKILNEDLFNVVDQNMLKFKATYQDEVASVLHVEAEDFENRITLSKRQRLKKNRTAFRFKRIPLTQVDSVYHFLAQCRKERGRKLSLSLRQVCALCEAFPRAVMAFTVEIQSVRAAAAIVVRESGNSWYTFYYSHRQMFNRQSPNVFLIEKLYDLARSKGVPWLNLGTSMSEGDINRPLLHFKKSLGAETTIKRTYRQLL